MTTIKKFSWDTITQKIEHFAQKIKQDPRSVQFEYLLIITRGGLIPGYFLAQELGIKKIKTLCLQSYTADRSQDTQLQHLTIPGFSEHITEPQKWLIVDEIADSGKSLAFVKQRYPTVATACLFTKNKDFCDFFGEHIPQDIWIDFPWEKYE